MNYTVILKQISVNYTVILKHNRIFTAENFIQL
jgi:hypothetical protein